jgi:hypothetical protein
MDSGDIFHGSHYLFTLDRDVQDATMLTAPRLEPSWSCLCLVIVYSRAAKNSGQSKIQPAKQSSQRLFINNKVLYECLLSYTQCTESVLIAKMIIKNRDMVTFKLGG